MKKMNRIFIPVLCILLFTLTGIAGAEKQTCICRDEFGVIYPENTKGSVLCYTCTEEDGCLPNGLTLKQCKALNESMVPTAEPTEAPVVQQPVFIPEPTQAPVVEQPVYIPEPTQAPVVEQPVYIPEPTQAPVVEQPVYISEPTEAPVVEQPVYNSEPTQAPIVEQPVYEMEPTEAPADEQPVWFEQPTEVTYTDPETDYAVTEEPANPEMIIIQTEESFPVFFLSGEETATDTPEEIFTEDPTEAPAVPVLIATEEETESPAVIPTEEETEIPVFIPTEEETEVPVVIPTEEETEVPVFIPTEEETEAPVVIPTEEETEVPVFIPTEEETEAPAVIPTEEGTESSEVIPTEEETEAEMDLTPTVEETPETTETPEVTETPEAEGELTVPLLGSGISIEGKLDQLALSDPDGAVFTSPDVTFTWVYTTENDTPVDVEFALLLTVTDLESSQVTTSSTVISSATCSNHICQYTAGSELSGFKKATVVWTVSGSFDDGGSTVVVYAANPDTMTFSLDVKDPTPTVTPTVTPTPTKPKAPVLECPVGDYHTRALGFYWAPSKGAETYTVNWQDDKGHHGSFSLKNSDSTCQKGRCIAHATMPGTGNYTWTVTAKNKVGSAKSKSMSFRILTNISTPTAYRPNNTIVNRNYPVFEWEDVEDGAVEYRVQVVGKYDNLIRMDRWFEVKNLYIRNGVCAVQTDLFLPAGTYSWRVQARNKDFTSGWSSWRDFYVECDYCGYYNGGTSYTNTVPTPSYPVGTITVTEPEFQWRTLTGAAYYMVALYNASGQQLFNKQVPSSNCTVELCKWNPGYKLPANGNYRWTVSGYGGNNALWNSATGSFTLQAPVVLNPISFVSPAQNGTITDESPVIIWTDPGSTTAYFAVSIYDRNNKELFSAGLTREQAWCDGQTCFIEFKTIPDAENYRITVTPYSELNAQGTMISLVFSKTSAAKVLTLSLTSPKEGSTVSARPMFRWPLTAGDKASYELTLVDADNHVRMYSPLICGAEGVTCEAGEGFFTPAQSLPSGTYTATLSLKDADSQCPEVRFTIR